MQLTPEQIAKGIASKDRRILAKAITLVESSLIAERAKADKLLTKVMPKTGKSIRLGISGVPGVGKSTFIEAFGKLVLKEFKQLAVLAIDPSSPMTGGSILGDKTRMEELARQVEVFIRPSPSAGSLGGVARNTREAILLCEAAGFDFVIVETVGVGQSEVAVAGMVDCFLMLQLPNAGDELQGIKKGVLELADMITINKCDGEFATAAKRARVEHERALHLVKSKDQWVPPVLTCSALNNEGISEVFSKVKEFVKKQKDSKQFQKRRTEQASKWFNDEILYALKDSIFASKKITKKIEQMEKDVAKGKVPASVAAHSLVKTIIK